MNRFVAVELALDLVPHVGLDRRRSGSACTSRRASTGVETPASSRIALALAGSGSPYASLKDSLAPGNAAGTVEYSGFDGALVDGLGDRVAVDALGDRLADRGVLDRLLVDVEDDVADLGAGAVDDLDAVGAVLRATRGRSATACGRRRRPHPARSPASAPRAGSKYWTMKFGVCALFGPVYSGFAEKTACWFGRVLVELVRARADRSCRRSASCRPGRSRPGRSPPTLCVRMNGKVASTLLSFIVTVVGSVASTESSEPSSVYGPVGSSILSIRSSENLTSSAVSGSPLENFRSGLSLQTYVFGIRELAALGGVRLGLVAARRHRQQGLVDVADHLLATEVVAGGRVQRSHLVGGAEDHGVGVATALRRRARPPDVSSPPSSLPPHAAAPIASSAVQPNTAIRCARISSAPLQWARVRPPPRPNLLDGRPSGSSFKCRNRDAGA